MFEWFPIFNGKYFTYQEYLFIFTIGTFSTISIVSFAIGLFLNRSKKSGGSYANLKISTTNSNDDYFEAKTDTSSLSADSYTSVYAPDNDSNYVKVPESGTRGGNAAIWVGWIAASLIPGSLATFHVWNLPMWLAVILDYSIIMMVIRYREKNDKMRLYHTLQQKDKLEAYEARSRPIVKFYKKMVVGVSIFSTVLPMIFNNFCASSFQSYVGPIFGSVSLSSQLTRFFQLSKTCPPGPPCQLYATLPEDASTSVFINAHTDENYETISILYDTQASYESSNELRYSKNSSSVEITGMENDGKRRMHSFLLTNLQPDTMYFFQLVYDGAVQASNYYRTLPGEDSTRDLMIIQGGDMGDTSLSRGVALAVSNTNPDLIVLGGDLAYDNGMCTCFFAWDYFLRDLDEINKKNGRLIPVISAVGNHDVGLDSLNGKNLKTTTDGPFYMVFFPQHSGSGNNPENEPTVPSLEEMKSYHYHKFGKIILFNLDSGYLEDVENEQLEWMQLVLDKHPSYLKFANYHVPMYFACKGNDKYAKDIVALQKEKWLPIFDAHNFAMAFENHEHHLKRTFAIRGDAVDDQGTIYIGNGQWGTDDHATCESYNQTGLYDNVQNAFHFWMINISYTGDYIENGAYNSQNNVVVPSVRQKLSDYMCNDCKGDL